MINAYKVYGVYGEVALGDVDKDKVLDHYQYSICPSQMDIEIVHYHFYKTCISVQTPEVPVQNQQ